MGNTAQIQYQGGTAHIGENYIKDNHIPTHPARWQGSHKLSSGDWLLWHVENAVKLCSDKGSNDVVETEAGKKDFKTSGINPFI